MNREIKFRVWDIKNREFTQENEYVMYLDGKNLEDGCENVYSVDGVFIIQQFTGLLDKNGKEIYEGDIIAPLIKNPVFSHGAMFAVEFKENLFREEGVIGFNVDTYQIYEILGNIFENPELTK